MPKYRFDDIAINSTEKKKPVEEDKYTYLGLEHLDSGSLKVTRFGSEVAPIGEKLVMRKGDVLFGKRRAYQKKVAIAPFDGIFSAHGMVLRPKENVIDKDFFPLFISSDYFLDAAIKISVGSLSPTINWKDLKTLEFELPSLEEQRKLAEVLWSINDTLDAYKKLLEVTDQLVKSQFMELFGKYPQDSKMKDLVTEIRTGKLNANAEVTDGEYPFFTCDSKPKRIDKYAFDTEAILVSGNGSQIGHINYYNGKFNAYQRTYVLSGFSSRVNIKYLLEYFKVFLKPYIVDNSIGSAIPYITLPMLENFMISVPTLSIQDDFVSFVEQSDKSKFDARMTSNLNLSRCLAMV